MTATTRTESNVVLTTRDTFGINHGQRRLLETTRIEEETRRDGTVTTVENTWVPDVNGRLGLVSRQIRHTSVLTSGIKETDMSVLRPGVEEDLQESERIHQTERQVTPGLRRTDTVLSVRDANGRFQPIESRSQEIQRTGSPECDGR